MIIYDYILLVFKIVRWILTPSLAKEKIQSKQASHKVEDLACNKWVFFLKELQAETDVPEKDLIRALQSLALGKVSQRVLTKEPKTKEIGKYHLETFLFVP